MNSIEIEDGALDHVPVISLATFLNEHGCMLMYRPSGLKIVRKGQFSQVPVDIPPPAGEVGMFGGTS